MLLVPFLYIYLTLFGVCKVFLGWHGTIFSLFSCLQNDIFNFKEAIALEMGSLNKHWLGIRQTVFIDFTCDIVMNFEAI
jgi:hypothetical protein